jgi:hypothetical protein
MKNQLAITVLIPFGDEDQDLEALVDYLCDEDVHQPDKLSLAVFIKSGEHRLISGNLNIPTYGGKGQKREILEALITQKGYK